MKTLKNLAVSVALMTFGTSMLICGGGLVYIGLLPTLIGSIAFLIFAFSKTEEQYKSLRRLLISLGCLILGLLLLKMAESANAALVYIGLALTVAGIVMALLGAFTKLK